MTSAFVTGGAGMVGQALVRALVADGVRVRALARSHAAAEAVQAAGAEAVHGDLLGDPGAWAPAAGAADVVWHLGLPRLDPPLRRARARRNAREAGRAARALARAAAEGGTPVVMASTGLVYGDRRHGPATEFDDPSPLAVAAAALAAERALAGPATRVVRLAWVYGRGGLARDLIVGLRTGRYRVVGPGDNRWALVAVDDTVAALRAAAAAPAGLYTAAEPDPPTQLEVVRALCAAPGLRLPDHIPLRVAAIALGGAMSEALGASLDLGAERLRAAGWSPAGRWREGLLALTEVDLPVTA